MDAAPDLAVWLNHIFPPSEAARLRTIAPFRPDDPVGRSPNAASAETPEVVARVLGEANAELAQRQIGLRFVQEEGLPRPIVQIVDQVTGDILRQIPNEDAVRMAQALTGLLVDRRA